MNTLALADIIVAPVRSYCEAKLDHLDSFCTEADAFKSNRTTNATPTPVECATFVDRVGMAEDQRLNVEKQELRIMLQDHFNNRGGSDLLNNDTNTSAASVAGIPKDPNKLFCATASALHVTANLPRTTTTQHPNPLVIFERMPISLHLHR